eukprot:473123-Pelagomonas_calceolata.AAC.1
MRTRLMPQAAAKKVASQENPGSQVQKARDTYDAKNIHSQFNFQGMSTKPKPAHTTHNLLRQIQKKIPRQ